VRDHDVQNVNLPPGQDCHDVTAALAWVDPLRARLGLHRRWYRLSPLCLWRMLLLPRRGGLGRLSLRHRLRLRLLLSSQMAVGRLQARWTRGAADDPAHG
jgi:hypothetical protein